MGQQGIGLEAIHPELKAPVRPRSTRLHAVSSRHSEQLEKETSLADPPACVPLAARTTAAGGAAGADFQELLFEVAALHRRQMNVNLTVVHHVHVLLHDN